MTIDWGGLFDWVIQNITWDLISWVIYSGGAILLNRFVGPWLKQHIRGWGILWNSLSFLLLLTLVAIIGEIAPKAFTTLIVLSLTFYGFKANSGYKRLIILVSGVFGLILWVSYSSNTLPSETGSEKGPVKEIFADKLPEKYQNILYSINSISPKRSELGAQGELIEWVELSGVKAENFDLRMRTILFDDPVLKPKDVQITLYFYAVDFANSYVLRINDIGQVSIVQYVEGIAEEILPWRNGPIKSLYESNDIRLIGSHKTVLVEINGIEMYDVRDISPRYGKFILGLRVADGEAYVTFENVIICDEICK